MINSILVISAY